MLPSRIADVPMPDNIRRLPRDERGWPIPFFVDYDKLTGKPVFPAFDPLKYMACVERGLCWVCGRPLGRHLAFTIGPMCVINRITSEPPTHYQCAEYSAKVCPFLANPRMRRLPPKLYYEGLAEPVPAGGDSVPDNPGGCVIWVAKNYTVLKVRNGQLIRLSDPERVEWYVEGRVATAQEAAELFYSGAARLRLHAMKLDGAAAMPELDRLTSVAAAMLPDPRLLRRMTLQDDGSILTAAGVVTS